MRETFMCNNILIHNKCTHHCIWSVIFHMMKNFTDKKILQTTYTSLVVYIVQKAFPFLVCLFSALTISSHHNLLFNCCRFVPVYRGSGGFGFTLSGNAPVFIRSMDPGGAAALAGLRAGDRLLQLNGLNIR